MFSFTCPHCRAQLQLDDSSRGHRVVCGSCGEGVVIATSTAPTSSAPQLRSHTEWQPATSPAVSVVPRTLRRKKKNQAVNVVVHVLISLTALAAIAYLYVNRPMNPATPPTPVVIHRTIPRPVKPRPAAPVETAPLPVVIDESEPEPAAPPPEPVPQDDPFEGLPTFVDLPDANAGKSVILRDLPAPELSLLSNGPVAIDGATVLVDDLPAATMTVTDGALQFQWAKGVSDEEQAAVRNSVLELSSGGATHRIALRAPVRIKAPLLGLKASSLKLYGKCDHPPEPSGVLVAVQVGHLPTKGTTGSDLSRLKMRDEAIVSYESSVDVASKVTVRPSGNVLVAEIESQYVLPSGDVEPLTISRGNRVLKELEDLHAAAIEAEQSIGRLRTYRARLNSELNRAQGIRTMSGGYENPAIVAQKNAIIVRVQNELIATEQNIARAEELIERKPTIVKDLEAIGLVAELAQSLKDSPIPYRFYMLVGGHEVDLVIAE